MVMRTSLGEGNSEFKPLKLRLNIDFGSHLVRVERLINIYSYSSQNSGDTDSTWLSSCQFLSNLNTNSLSMFVYK